jgi:hypothetical protein
MLVGKRLRSLRLMFYTAGAILAVVFAIQNAFAQVQAPRSIEVPQLQGTQIYPMPGCERLWRGELEVQRYVDLHPEVQAATQLAKKTAWNFNVGDTHSWWATNMVTNQEYPVPSTCRGVGTHAYYFVEDSLWQSGRVNQAAVDSIGVAFDLSTPANSQKGIYDTDVETFGDPPDVDADPRIVILILDIKDGYAGGSGSYTAGYFYSINEYPDGSIPGHRSNDAEIYYVDAYPADLTSSGGLQNAASTTAHEFQHMIHWAHDKNEITFINESCSEVASLVCGYPFTGQGLYTDAPDIALLSWSGSLADYSRAARWCLYLWNQFPNGYLKLLVDNKGTGITGVDNALGLYAPPTARRFNDILPDWMVANYLNDASVDSRYAYTYSSTLTTAKGISYITPNVASKSNAISPLAADYVSFTSGQSLNITFSSSSNLVVKAIEIGPASKRVLSVPLNAAMSEPEFGTTYSSITFVVMNLSQSSDGSYGYQATGTGGGVVELKWDETEPTGYLRLSPLDTVCVTFDAVGGAMLDSVRVALRRAGVVKGGVWRYTGAPVPTPLGAPLAKPITASTTLTPPVLDAGATYPYASPYPNWRTIDLRSYNIPTDQPFVVGFWLESDTSNDGRVMTTLYNSSDAYHSFTYLHNPSGGVPGWYYLSGGGSDIYLYLIRAYASVRDTSVPTPVPTVPLTMTLQQNYPNPFNSSTKIRYSISADGHVKLLVFDLMGRLIATLVDAEESEGEHEAEWNGRTMNGSVAASGVYFYRLQSGRFQGTEKMILLR